MNLIELSKITGLSEDELTDIIYTRFNKIILSQFCHVDNCIVDYFISNMNVKPLECREHKAKKITYSSDNKKDDENTELKKCLKAMKTAVDSNKKYTLDLIDYCIANNFIILLDTCSLLYNEFYKFYEMFLSRKKERRIRLFIPFLVKIELENIAINPKKYSKKTADKAKKIIDFLNVEIDKDNIAVVGGKGDFRKDKSGNSVMHADRVIIEKLIYLRNNSINTLLITQDANETADALEQNDWKSTNTDAVIVVKKIGKGGVLINNTSLTVNPKLPIDK